MHPLAPITLGMAPALCWLLWVRWHDRHAPEPRGLVLRAFAAGAMSTALVLIARPWLEQRLPIDATWSGAAVDAFLLTAPLEETVKLLALLAAVFWHRAWDEPFDGFVYGAAVGLGFASIENAGYVLQSGDAGLAWARGMTATLVHLATTGGLGALLWNARHGPIGRRLRHVVLAWSSATVLHGGYDVFLFGASGQLGWVSLVVVLPLLLVWLLWALARARAQSTIGEPMRKTSSTRPLPSSSSSAGTAE